MADTKATLNEIDAKGLSIKLIDNGDGTFSLGVSDTTTGGGTTTREVHGTTPDGNAFSDNPVILGYVDSGGLAQQVEEGVTELPVSSLPGTGELRDTVGDATLPIKTAFVDVSTSGEHTLVAAVAGSKIRVLSWRAQHKGATVETIQFRDGAAGAALTFDYALGEREGAHATSAPGSFEFETTAGNALVVNKGVAEATGVHVSYVEV